MEFLLIVIIVLLIMMISQQQNAEVVTNVDTVNGYDPESIVNGVTSLEIDQGIQVAESSLRFLDYMFMFLGAMVIIPVVMLVFIKIMQLIRERLLS